MTSSSSSVNICSPAGELTSDFVLFSGTTASTEEERDVWSSPLRETETIMLNEMSEERLLVDEDGSEIVLQSPLLIRNDSYTSTSAGRRRRGNAELNGLNYLNVVTYAAYLFVSWGIGIWGLDGLLETRWEILAQYETLVTPAHWAYYLWAPILILEGVFTVAQLLPHYRARPLIQGGTKYFFFYTFIIQTVWTICFSFRIFIGSFISVVATLLSLLRLLALQHKSLESVRTASFLQYILFRLPFYLHTGWMVLMTVDHLSLLLRCYAAEHVSLQVAVDILALAIMLVAATTALTIYSPIWWPQQDFVIPLVVIWSYIGIACRLEHPSAVMIEVYGQQVIQAVQYAAFLLAGLVACCLIPCVVVWTTREFCTIGVVEFDV